MYYFFNLILPLLSDNTDNGARGWQTCFLQVPLFNIKTITTMEELKEIIEVVKTHSKEVLTAQETASYMGVSMSYLYKLTMRKQIPHYKPLGKMCYFNRVEVEQWLQSNRVSTDQELNNKALSYCRKGAI